MTASVLLHLMKPNYINRTMSSISVETLLFVVRHRRPNSDLLQATAILLPPVELLLLMSGLCLNQSVINLRKLLMRAPCSN